MNVVVFDPKLGLVAYAQIFDTYTSSEPFEEFIWGLKKINYNNFIVITACKDECTTKLSETVRYWYDKMGSK